MKKMAFVAGIIFLVILLGSAMGISMLMVYDEIQAEDHWIDVPVFVCVETMQSKGEDKEPFGWNSECVNCGKLWILLVDNKFKTFVYEDLEGRRHINDWNSLANNLKDVERKELESKK